MFAGEVSQGDTAVCVVGQEFHCAQGDKENIGGAGGELEVLGNLLLCARGGGELAEEVEVVNGGD
jgi:hypothetical protein